MQVHEVMTTWVATIGADASVREGRTTDDRAAHQRAAGLVRRSELGTASDGSWWLKALAEGAALDYVKAHALAVRDVMTSPVISVRRSTPLSEVARLMEERHVKRLPVLDAGRLVGIVSRADLVRALAAGPARA